MNRTDKIKKETENYISESFAETEALESYKLKKILKHLNMSVFDYNIQKDTVYIRKESILLRDFTPYWFVDGGDYYYLENLTERLQDIIRTSSVNAIMAELDKVKHNTSGEMISVDAPIVYEAGNTRWTQLILDTILDEKGNPVHVIGYCKDIQEQKKELFRLRNVAQTDQLTGFRNRAAGIAKIRIRMAEEKDSTCFIAVIDLDKFKSANDLFGHSFGDLILKNVADRIRDFFDHETICCRTGGDEFLFYRICDDTAHAMDFLTRLENHLEHTVVTEDAQFDVRASIGVSIYPLQGTEFEQLYNKADAAMYYAKNNGIDVPVLYEDTMDCIRK